MKNNACSTVLSNSIYKIQGQGKCIKNLKMMTTKRCLSDHEGLCDSPGFTPVMPALDPMISPLFPVKIICLYYLKMSK